MTNPSSMVCDVCSHSLRTGSGYILLTGDVVSSPGYWEQNFKTIKEIGRDLSFPMVLGVVGEMSDKYSPWMICDRCIDLFDADRAAARQRAMKYWSSGEAPAGGAGDRDAAMRAALTALTEMDEEGFPVEWPHQ